MIRKIFFLAAVFSIAISSVDSQCISSVHSKWDDSFVEWELYCEQDEQLGTLGMRFPINEDWSKWDFRIGEESGSIQLKWKDDPEVWEITNFGEVVLAKTIWPRDFSQWRISDSDIQLTFRSRYPHRTDEWYMSNKRYGNFTIQTQGINDPRDWLIFDETSEEVSFAMKLAMIFVAIHHGSPKL